MLHKQTGVDSKSVVRYYNIQEKELYIHTSIDMHAINNPDIN